MQDSNQEEETQNKSFERSPSLRLPKTKDNTEEKNSQKMQARRVSLGGKAKSVENLRAIGRKIDISPLFKRKSNKETSTKTTSPTPEVTRSISVKSPSPKGKRSVRRLPSLPLDVKEGQTVQNGQRPRSPTNLLSPFT